jgi:crotonobetainyl-CoA:carnitine CoA-transferase CaiB-like acyl-CoA transferase
MPHVVPRLLGTPGAIRSPAPGLGQHNKDLLSEIGISAFQYEELLRAGIVSEDVSGKSKEQ